LGIALSIQAISRNNHDVHPSTIKTKNESPARNAIERGTTALILGCMFSGKTTELIRRVAQSPTGSVLAIKHAIDTRYASHAILSHGGTALPATAVSAAAQIVELIRKETRTVAIDEGHFFDLELASVICDLNERGLHVVLTSLEPDSWGRPFPINERLREVADECVVRHAACARCGALADHTQRLTPIVGGNMVVDPSQYEPRCQACWRPPIQSP